METYFGGKGASGVHQTLINQIPPHRVYISAFAGADAVLKRIRPAGRTVIIDKDPTPLKWWARTRPDAELFNCDAVTWLRHEFAIDRCDIGRRPDFSDWFCLLDPPYLRSTRSSQASYLFEFDNEHEHGRLLDLVLQLPCRVMLCTYPNPIYAKVLHDWRTVQYNSTVRSGQQRAELLYLNYSEPERLHDYRFLGGDKRERERIRRRCRHWAAGLKKMPPHERAAIIDAILGGGS